MMLAILTERDFVGGGGGESLGCETAQGDALRLRSFSVTPCRLANTA